MLHRLIGAGTTASLLKQGLTEGSERVRGIASRVANVSTPGAPFAGVLAEATQGTGAAGPVDLEREMVALADEQIRYEAASRLLQKVYAQVRSSVRER